MASLPVRSFDGASVIRCSRARPTSPARGRWQRCCARRRRACSRCCRGTTPTARRSATRSRSTTHCASAPTPPAAAGTSRGRRWTGCRTTPSASSPSRRRPATRSRPSGASPSRRADGSTSVAPSGLMNPPSFGTNGYVYFGQYNLDTGYRFEGDLAAVAVWAAELGEATLDQLAAAPSMAGWAGVASPRALWLFDQTSTSTLVSDLVGSAREDRPSRHLPSPSRPTCRSRTGYRSPFATAAPGANATCPCAPARAGPTRSPWECSDG